MYLPQDMKECHGTCSFTEYITHGWTSEVSQLFYFNTRSRMKHYLYLERPTAESGNTSHTRSRLEISFAALGDLTRVGTEQTLQLGGCLHRDVLTWPSWSELADNDVFTHPAKQRGLTTHLSASTCRQTPATRLLTTFTWISLFWSPTYMKTEEKLVRMKGTHMKTWEAADTRLTCFISAQFLICLSFPWGTCTLS